MPVHLRAIGRSVPATRYTQDALYAYRPWQETPLLHRLFFDSPIQSRALAVEPSFYRSPRTLDETNARWRAAALGLGGAALRGALHSAGLDPIQIDLLAVTTVTGYATPGLDLLLAHQEGLRSTIQRTHFNNVGCHAAIPLLRTAVDHVAQRPGAVGVALAVEVCSACFSPDDDVQNIVAISLFADGAAAAVVSTTGDGPIVVDFESAFDFENLDALAFDLTPHGFRIVLDPKVPHAIGRGVEAVVGRLLDRNGVTRDRVSTWAFHPGGARILDEVAAALALDEPAMRHSRRVLRGYGNMSSPSVLFVLSEALRDAPPAPGTFGVLAAFGPGLGIECCLLSF